MHSLDKVLLAAPTGCGRSNNVDWPCGVLVVSRVPHSTLRNAFVATTRSATAFRSGVLVQQSGANMPSMASSLVSAMNGAARKSMYRHVYCFAVAHQTDRVDVPDWELVATLSPSARPFPPSAALLSALGEDALSPDYRYEFFRM